MSSALPIFVISLREGIEVALVVSIVLACLHKLKRDDLDPWVYGGIGGGVMISILVGIGFNFLIQGLGELSPVLKPLLEGLFSLVAIAMLSWMLIWMASHGQQLKGELTASVQQSLGQSAGWGIFNLVLFAVLREGFEVVIFITAQLQEPAAFANAIAGLACSAMFGLVLFKFGMGINLGLFLRSMGSLLLLIVAGLVISTLGHFDRAIALLSLNNPQFSHFCLTHDLGSCILGGQVWNLQSVLPQRQFPGIILRSLLGYTDRLYLGQAIAYGAFLVLIWSIYSKSVPKLKSNN